MIAASGVTVDFRLFAMTAPDQIGGQANNREPAAHLATLYRFEQKAVFLVGRQFQIGGNRRLRVCHQFA